MGISNFAVQIQNLLKKQVYIQTEPSQTELVIFFITLPLYKGPHCNVPGEYIGSHHNGGTGTGDQSFASSNPNWAGIKLQIACQH